MADQSLLLSWLNDAYAMENGIIQVLDKQVAAAKDYPQVQAKVKQHLEATRRHAELVKSCIERTGGSASSVKSAAASAFGWMQGIIGGMPSDAIVKNGIADFAVEHFEIASYNALIAAAKELGKQDIVSTCQQILKDEEVMANWLEQNLPTVVRESMNRTAVGAST